MTDQTGPRGLQEAYEEDDRSRMRRVHDDLDREYQEIPRSRHRRDYGGSVPSICERARYDPEGRR
jgi:hypothetical protein